jgi:hypothetical protein
MPYHFARPYPPVVHAPTRDRRVVPHTDRHMVPLPYRFNFTSRGRLKKYMEI